MKGKMKKPNKKNFASDAKQSRKKEIRRETEHRMDESIFAVPAEESAAAAVDVQVEKKIVEFLRNQEKPMTALDMIAEMDEDAEAISYALVRMTRDGKLTVSKKGKYALPETAGLIPARALILRSGVPIAKPLDGSDEIRIDRHGDLRAMNGDLILVRRLKRGRFDAHEKCELVAVTERAHPTFTAILCMAERKIEQPPISVKRGRRTKLVYQEPEIVRVLSAEPFDMRILCNIDVEGDLKGAQLGDAVVLRVVEYPRHKVPMRAIVDQVLGAGWDVRVQMKALIESHSLRHEFPDDVLAQANGLGEQVAQDDLFGRRDARDVTLFTIDGADAKDFDDAVSLEKTENGAWRLGVHIADVSHYVREGSPIDREALKRGTSVYLPGMVLPMLPEALSNCLCSLMPDVDRLALSLWMDIEGGEVIDARLERTVIHSAARLTYDQVNLMLEGKESNVPAALHETLHNMLSLSHVLREKRHNRGSIDFDMAEPQFTLDENGMPTDVRARVRGEAEKLIEDFMLIANETVAQMTRTRRIPALYRVHETPDPERLHSLELFLNNMNHPFRIGLDPQPIVIQKLLEETADTPEADVIKQMTLRSLKRACYSENPSGHFGLAAKDYCHFTSPIRRYPDLLVHRQLCRMLTGQTDDARARAKDMPELAAQCSSCEFAATAAERDGDDLIRAHYMKNHVGEEFDGVVSGVTTWGCYVTLPNTVEGLVHVKSLDDYYEFDEVHQILRAEHSRHTLKLGDKVRVKLEAVNVMACEIDFSLCREKGRSKHR